MRATHHTIHRNKEPDIKNYDDFNRIVYQYTALLHRYANWFIPVKAAAGRIVANTFRALLENKHSFYTRKEIRTFLKKHIRQQCMNWLHAEALRLRKTSK